MYLNISSLFQSNFLRAGINYNDPTYQFVLSQADGVLRFLTTDLTPTNYMNYLLDTNESGTLATWGVAFPVMPTGVALPSYFIGNIATNHGGILLVEAATNTTQPLVLTIYHGTNQIAQTSLYLSISGVEQMFRHKNLLLNIPPAMPDRLTDASVPNEPDTVDKNFVFLHGYNVLPNEARGVAADMYKRMYWSSDGSGQKPRQPQISRPCLKVRQPWPQNPRRQRRSRAMSRRPQKKIRHTVHADRTLPT